MVADLALSIRFPVEGASPNGDAQRAAWREAIAAVEGLRELTDDWDGDGAATPARENIAAAIEWLNQMPLLDRRAIPPTQITAGALGEVLFVWQTGSQFIEAEIEQPECVEWMVKVGAADPEFCLMPIARDAVFELDELPVVRC